MLKDIAVSYGSTCDSNSFNTSHVLSSLGISKQIANQSISFSFGRFTTEEEIYFTVDLIKCTIKN